MQSVIKDMLCITVYMYMEGLVHTVCMYSSECFPITYTNWSILYETERENNRSTIC